MSAEDVAARISAYRLAQEIGVTVQAIYKRVKKDPALMALRVGTGWNFDTQGAAAVRKAFQSVVEPVVEPTVTDIKPVVELVVEPVQQLINRLTDEVEFLRSELETARAQNMELVQQLAEIAKNNQTLMALDRQKKLPFWRRLFQRPNDNA